MKGIHRILVPCDLKEESKVALHHAAILGSPNAAHIVLLHLIKSADELSKAESEISKYGQAVSNLMNTAPQARNTFNQLFTTYVNKKIVAGNLSNLTKDFMEYVQTRPMSEKMKAKINEHLQNNKEGVTGAFKIWSAIYNLKMDVVKQLDRFAEKSPVKGYLQDGTQTHEGFVSNGLKFVDRMGFSRQNLAGR